MVIALRISSDSRGSAYKARRATHMLGVEYDGAFDGACVSAHKDEGAREAPFLIETIRKGEGHARTGGIYTYNSTPSPQGMRFLRGVKQEEEGKGPQMKIEYSAAELGCSSALPDGSHCYLMNFPERLEGGIEVPSGKFESGGTKRGEMSGEAQASYIIGTPLSRSKESGPLRSSSKQRLMLSSGSRVMSLGNSFEKGGGRAHCKEHLHHSTPEGACPQRSSRGECSAGGFFDPAIYLDLGNSGERTRLHDLCGFSPSVRGPHALLRSQSELLPGLRLRRDVDGGEEDGVLRNPFKNITNLTGRGIAAIDDAMKGESPKRELRHEDLFSLLPTLRIKSVEETCHNKENL